MYLCIYGKTSKIATLLEILKFDLVDIVDFPYPNTLISVFFLVWSAVFFLCSEFSLLPEHQPPPPGFSHVLAK